MKIAPVLVFAFLSLQSYTQDLAHITVFSGDVDRLNCPISVDLGQISYNEDNGALILVEELNRKEIPVSCQVETGHLYTLWFILSGETKKGESRNFVIRQNKGEQADSPFELIHNGGKLELSQMGRPVLNYQFGTVYPPEGVDPLFRRSGFIHPLWSPGGHVLTRIQAPDHYHHYGIWGPWTMTHINGREVDFWNLMKGQGTVRFAGMLSEVAGPVYSGYKALQEHIDFGARGEDQVAINEILDVRVWNIDDGNVWLIDYTSTLNTPIDSGIMLDAYRYGGGIGFRANELWHKDNSSILTSEIMDRLTADGTKARWCIVEGESGSEQGRSGILFMGHTANREFPEPMRVWPVDANGGRGDMFFEFCPIRHNNWMLNSGKNYTLKYRMLVFDGTISAEIAEMYWQGFAHPPKVVIRDIK